MISSNSLNSVYDIPILAYHKVSPQTEFGLTTIHPDTFQKHIDYLYDHGYRTVTFEDLTDPVFSLPAKPVILTFDDAYDCIYQYARPVMNKYAFRSVLFVITGYIGKKNTWEAFRIQQKHFHLSEAHIKELHREGHEIGSHSVTHPFMSTLPAAKAEAEIRQSKADLQDLVGAEIMSFCYPYGKYSPRIARILQTNNFQFATVNRGIFNSTRPNTLDLPRSSIYSSDSLKILTQKIQYSNRLNLPRVADWLIQRGAMTGILRKSISQILRHRVTGMKPDRINNNADIF